MKMRARKRLNDRWQTDREARRFRARLILEIGEYPGERVHDDRMDAYSTHLLLNIVEAFS